MSSNEQLADGSSGTNTFLYLTNGAPATGTIESVLDFDAFGVYLVAGIEYHFYLNGNHFPSGISNEDAFFRLYSPSGENLLGTSVTVPVTGDTVESLFYTPSTSGLHFVQVAGGGNVGSYYLQSELSYASGVPDDYSANWATAPSLSYNTIVTGQLEIAGDEDGFLVSTVAGQRYYYEYQSAVPDLFAQLKGANYDTLSYEVLPSGESGTFVAADSSTVMFTVSSNSFVETGSYYFLFAPTYSNTANLVVGTALNDSLVGTADQDEIHGSWGSDSLSGLGGNDFLFGGPDASNDVLSGGTGSDRLDGGDGNDTYVLDNEASGIDLIIDSSGTADSITSTISRSLASFSGIENLTLTGSADINGTGNALSNVLIGNAGINVLNGGVGADNMRGLAGNDVYVVDNASDIVNESIAGSTGSDTVQSSISFSLADTAHVLGSVENLTLLGSGNINGTGNALNNVLTGNAGINVLNGGAGADNMRGLAGNDVYVVDNASDIVNESIAGSTGSDTVQSSISFSLADTAHVLGSVENLTLLGSGNINGTGNALSNVLIGNAGINVLNGGVGADNMRGLAGNDVYVVDNASDIVNESIAGSTGSDTVQSSISFSLADTAHVLGSVENLTLLGSGNINGTGNALNNVLTGNAGINVLNGGAGADNMRGLAGNDVYVVDNASDIVNESIAGSTGSDTVQSSISFSLADTAHVLGSVENLTLLGSGNINGTGNALSNVLIGNAGINVLNGGVGADNMRGLAGNDVYVVDNASDIVNESIAGSTGSDTVQSSINFSLADTAHVLGSVENLTLLGSGNINSTGNALSNVLIGNAAINVLNGGAGNDTLSGGTGNDTLIGGAGSDNFVFNTALNATTNVDRISDFNAAADTMRLENAIFTTLTALGTLAAGAFASNLTGLAGDSNDRIIYEKDTGKLYYDANGSKAGGGIHFATLSSDLSLTNADFFIV